MSVAEIRGWCELAITEFNNSIFTANGAFRESENSPGNLNAAAKNMEEAQGASMAQASQVYSIESARTATELDIAGRVLPAITEAITCLEKGYTALLGAGMDMNHHLLEAGVSIARANEYYGDASGRQVLVITHLESVPNLAHGVVHETIGYAAVTATQVQQDMSAGMNATSTAVEQIQAYLATL